MQRIKKLKAGGLIFYCPGCGYPHSINTDPEVQWEFNNNYIKPTLKPDIKVFRAGWQDQMICHFLILDGYIIFLWDCSHNLYEKVIELPVWPYSDNYPGVA